MIIRSIHLSDLRFYAHHGWYSEETMAGGGYLVNVSIDFEGPDTIQHLDDTINYVAVYDRLKQVFNSPAKLLETVADDACSAITEVDKRIKTINITITKLNPPVSNFIGSVGVSLLKSY